MIPQSKYNFNTCNKIIKIVLIEDNPADVFLIKNRFKKSLQENNKNINFEIVDFAYLFKAITYLEENDCDLILLDLNLPDSNNLETFYTIQKYFPKIPIIILSVIDNEELARKAISLGAQDYFMKGKTYIEEIFVSFIYYALQRYHIKEKLEETNQELQLKTKELEEANQKLKIKTEELKETNQELESFNYTLSHDLRNPLSNIKGFTYILKKTYKDKLDSEAINLLKQIDKSSDQMNHIIKDIIQLFKIKKKHIEFIPFNISKKIQGLIHLKEYSHPNISVNINIKPDIIVNGDEDLLELALQNLVGNAWKFSQKKETIYIEFGVINDEIKQKEITQKYSLIINQSPIYYLKDKGAGFDMENVAKIFEPFQRLHHKDEFEGTGIGLATVKKIIKLHRGDIWAEGKVNEGATFYFTLNT